MEVDVPGAILPDNETDRLALLCCLDLMDHPLIPALDDLVRRVADELACPICLITLIDSERQFFLANCGLPVPETPREFSFCSHALLQPARPMVISDARFDPRTMDNPLVLGEPYLRAYAGVPIAPLDGLALGTLCVADTRPRQFTANDLHILAKASVEAWAIMRVSGSRRGSA
jgi:GAF domain-containing protein